MKTSTIASSLPISALALLTACAPQDETNSAQEANLSVPLPAFIADVRAVDTAAVTPLLQVNGTTYSMSRSGNTWQAQVTVPKDSTHDISLSWSELYEGRELPLGEYSGSVTVGSSDRSFAIDSSDYDASGFDLDGDGSSNLAERRAGTNPYLDDAIVNSVDVVVPRIGINSNLPTLDGRVNTSAGEWADAVQVDTSGALLEIDNRMFEEEGADLADGQPKSRWAALHDGTYLYLLVLADDNGNRQHDSTDVWEDDNLNVYLDGAYSHTSTYNADGAGNDFHILIPLLTSGGFGNDSTSSGSRFLLGANSAAIASSAFQFSNGAGSSGEQGVRGNPMDVYEFRIPLSQLDTSPGSRFGIDIHLDDDDNGGIRDVKWAWFHPSGSDQLNNDNTYQNPSYMAAAALEK